MRALLAALMLAPIAAQAGDFASCIIDRVPGAENDIAAKSAFVACKEAFPDGYNAATRGTGRGLLAYESGFDCAAKEAHDTRSHDGAAMILRACKHLYDEPNAFDQFDKARK